MTKKTKKKFSKKHHNLKYRYGITEEQYNQLHLTQKGKCAICKQDASLYVDHCHKEGQIRGLLCCNCNTGIGLLKESKDNLERAIEYLKQRTEASEVGSNQREKEKVKED